MTTHNRIRIMGVLIADGSKNDDIATMAPLRALPIKKKQKDQKQHWLC